jgi:hypothetical protein
MREMERFELQGIRCDAGSVVRLGPSAADGALGFRCKIQVGGKCFGYLC